MVGTRRHSARTRRFYAIAAVLRGLVIVTPVALSAGLAIPSRSEAQTLISPRVGGLELTGPATARSASVFYNPAIWGLIRGDHLYLSGSALLAIGSARLAPIDNTTGEPSGAAALGEEAHTSELSSLFFAAAHSDFGSESVFLGFAVYNTVWVTPSSVRNGDGALFDPAIQPPNRYHGIELDVFQLYVSGTAAVRFTRWLLLGFSVNYIRTELAYAFVHDAALHGGSTLDRDQNGQPLEYVALDDCGAGRPCGYGANAAAEAIRVDGSQDALGFAWGLLLQPHRSVDVGAALVTGPWVVLGNPDASGNARVRRAQAVIDNAGADPRVPALQRDLTGRGTLDLAFPVMIYTGLTWRAWPRLTFDAQLRWMGFSEQQALTVGLSGRALSATPAVPDRIVHHRGFNDVYSAQLGANFQLNTHLQLEGAVLLESPAPKSSAVTAIAVDGWKTDLLLAAHWKPWSWLSLRAGYSIAIMPARSVASSAFSPSHMANCVDAAFDIDLPQCQAAAAGEGLASSAGRYTRLVQRLGIAIGLHR